LFPVFDVWFSTIRRLI